MYHGTLLIVFALLALLVALPYFLLFICYFQIMANPSCLLEVYLFLEVQFGAPLFSLTLKSHHQSITPEWIFLIRV